MNVVREGVRRGETSELEALQAEYKSLNRASDPAGYWADYDSRLQETWTPIVEQGLQRNVAELDALGYTVVDPDVRFDLIERMREHIFATAERHWGAGARDGTALEASNKDKVVSGMQINIAAEPAFVEAITNPRLVALVRYLLGQGACYMGNNAFYKARGAAASELHIDWDWPDVLPAWDFYCNAAWLLTDVKVPEEGALSFVPGSHRFRRQPTPADQIYARQRSVPVLAKAGSVVLFRGSTWHGAPPKETAGIRVHVALFYQRRVGGVARPEITLPEEVIAAIPQATRDVLVDPQLGERFMQRNREKGGMLDSAANESDVEWLRWMIDRKRRLRGFGSPYV